jgi:hypothetical protein
MSSSLSNNTAKYVMRSRKIEGTKSAFKQSLSNISEGSSKAFPDLDADGAGSLKRECSDIDIILY